MLPVISLAVIQYARAEGAYDPADRGQGRWKRSPASPKP
jgi:hypothetical protein